MDIESRERLRKILLYITETLVVVALLFCAWKFNWVDGRLTYVVNGEEYKKVVAVRTENIALPESPTVDGYDFLGWYYDDGTFEKEFALSDLPEFLFFKRTTVYAKLVEHNHRFELTVLKKPTCEKSGLQAEVCTLNGCTAQKNSTTLPKINHTFENGVITKNVSGGITTFDFVGTCDMCNKVFNKKNASVTEKIYKVESCLQEGKYQYTYKALGINFVYTEIVEKLSHILNGNPIDKYVYSETGNVIYGTENVALNENETITCGGTAGAHYVCESCSRHISVTVEKLHNIKRTPVIAASCTDSGVYDLYCINEDCEHPDLGQEDIPAHGHNLINTLSKNPSGDFIVISECKRDGCDVCNTFPVDSSDVSDSITTPATCSAVGVKTYFYEFNGETVLYNESIPRTSHRSNGSLVSNYTYEDGTVKTSLPGLQYFGNTQEPTCENQAKAFYYCDICDPDKTVPIFALVYKDHNYSYVTTKNATCTEDGSKLGTCSDCKKTTTVTIEAFGHNYDWTLTIENNGAPFSASDIKSVSGKCTVCEAVTPVIDVATGTVSYSYSKAANCKSINKRVYNFKSNSETYGAINVTEYINDGLGEHTLNNVFISKLVGNDGVADNDPAVSGVVATTTLKLSIEGVSLLGNDNNDVKCQTVRNGWFICECCNTIVSHPVFVDHYVPDGKWTVKTQPTCGVDGVKTGKCIDPACGALVERAIPATQKHKMGYKLVAVYDNETNEIDSFDIFTCCENCSTCDKKMSNIDASKATSEITSVGNCCEMGICQYSYRYNGNLITCDEKIPGPHILNGVDFNEFKNSKGHIPSNIDGISLPEDYHTINDGDIVNGGFVCEKCEEFIKSSVIVVDEDD